MTIKEDFEKSNKALEELALIIVDTLLSIQPFKFLFGILGLRARR